MGPTGSPTHIAANETAVLVGGGLGNAVLFSIGAGAARRGLAGALFRRLQEGDRPLQGRRDRGRRRRHRLVLRRGARLPRRSGRRTSPSSATSCRRWKPTRRAGSARSRSRCPTGDRIIAIGSDRMMAAVARARHGVLAPLPQSASLRDRLDQLADAVHDEGDLRAVPAAAARSADRRGDVRVLLLQPGPAARLRRLPRAVRPPAPELAAGEADGAVDRALPARAARASAQLPAQRSAA